MAVTAQGSGNESFAKATPSGNLSITIDNETPAVDAFEVGKDYFLDFIPCEEEKQDDGDATTIAAQATPSADTQIKQPNAEGEQANSVAPTPAAEGNAVAPTAEGEVAPVAPVAEAPTAEGTAPAETV